MTRPDDGMTKELPRYRIERLLGRGASGTVHLALDRITGERVAVKRCDGASRDGAAREADLLASIRFPGVVSLVDVTADAAGAFVAIFEYLEGDDLVSACRAMSLDWVAQRFGEVLRALQFVHQRGLIHRDLKPENILCSSVGGELRAHLIDFGLSGTPGGVGGGTLAYLAPEVIQGDGASVRSDLYAVGLLLYEVLAAGLPSAGLRGIDIARLHSSTDLVLPNSVARGVPRRLDELVRILLRRDPALRPGSCAEVIDGLGRAIEGDVATETPATLRGRVESGRCVSLEWPVDQVVVGTRSTPVRLLIDVPPGPRPWLISRRIAAAANGATIVHISDVDVAGLRLLASPATELLFGADLLVVELSAEGGAETWMSEFLSAALDRPGLSLWIVREDDVDGDALALPQLNSLRHLTFEALSAEEGRHFVASALEIELPAERRSSLRIDLRYTPMSLTEGLNAAIDAGLIELNGERIQWNATRWRERVASPRLIDRVDRTSDPGSLPTDQLEILSMLAMTPLPIPMAALEERMEGVESVVRRLAARGLIELTAEGDVEIVSDAVAITLTRRCSAERLARLRPVVARVLAEGSSDERGLGEAGLLLREEDRGLAREWLFEAGRRLRQVGRSPEARGYLDAGFELTSAGDAPWRRRFLRWLGDCDSLEGSDESALAHSLAAIDEPGEIDDLVAARTTEARSRLRLGDAANALVAVELGLAEASATPLVRSLAYTTRSMILRDRGRLDEAIEAARLGLDELGAEPSLERGAAVMALANAYAHRGDVAKAVASYREAAQLGDALGRASLVDFARSNIGRLLYESGDARGAFEALRPVLDQFERSGALRTADGVLVTLVLCCNALGDLETARALGTKGRTFFETAGTRTNYAAFLRHVAEAELRAGNKEGAEDLARESLRIRIEADAPSATVAVGHAMLARVLHWRGDPHEARGELVRALAHLRGDPATGERVEVFVIASDLRRMEGKLDAASRFAKRALAAATGRGVRSIRAAAARCALVSFAADSLDEAGRRLDIASLASDGEEEVDGGDQLIVSAIGAARSNRTLEERSERLAELVRLAVGDGLAWERGVIESVHAWIWLDGAATAADPSGGTLDSGEEVHDLLGRVERAHGLAQSALRRFDAVGCVPWSEAAEALLKSVDSEQENRIGTNRSLVGLDRRLRGLERLLELNKAINSELDPIRLLNLILDEAIDLCGARRGFLILVRKRQVEVKVARNFVEQDIQHPEFEFSHSVASDVATGGEPIMTSNALHDQRLRSIASIAELRVLSILCVPLRSRRETLGSIYLDHPDVIDRFDHGDLEMLSDFAWAAGIALERARLYQENVERATALEGAKQEIERLNSELMRTVAAQAHELVKVKDSIENERRAASRRYDYRNIITQSNEMEDVLRLLDRITETDLPVLILGESGTGKELVSRAIHHNGPRKEAPFVSVNCAAMAEPLIEAELFGYVKGAFTGADRDRKGLFEVAHEGTLFLDEIGDMSLEVQKRLLRALQYGEFYRVGGKEPIHVNVRVISATHRDLRERIAAGLFREDLYYRINVAAVHLPALRERKGDVALLVQHFAEEYSRTQEMGPKTFSAEAIELLARHTWPGNIRELQNEVRRLLFLRPDRDRLEVDDLPPALRSVANISPQGGGGDGSLKEQVDAFQRRIVREVLREAKKNKTEAARRLGMTPRGLYKLLERLEIDTDD